jgi:hypothetical protein
MLNRAILVAALTGLVALGTTSGAQAQAPFGGRPDQINGVQGWTFNVAPYVWMPTFDAGVNYPLPPAIAGRVPTSVYAAPADYIDKINFVAAGTFEARYDRWSILTDVLYMNIGTTQTHIREVDFLGQVPIPVAHTRDISARLSSTIWTQAGGYTLARGTWGNFEVLVGFRYLGVSATTDYALSAAVAIPGGPALATTGSFAASKGIWNGIAGIRGRFLIGDSGMFIPYYLDVGAGGSKSTLQVATGLGYQTGWAGVSLTYRYLAFNQGSGDAITHLRMGGPMLMVTFSF